MGRGERRTGLGHEEPLVGVARQDLVEPAEAQHDLAASRDRAADEARVATLGHDRHLEAEHSGQHLGDLRRVAGADHNKGGAAESLSSSRSRRRL